MSYLDERIKAHKRRYKRVLESIKVMAESELEGLDDDIYDPSTALATHLSSLLTEAASLRTLIDLKERGN